jgi:hypothetical protein
MALAAVKLLQIAHDAHMGTCASQQSTARMHHLFKTPRPQANTVMEITKKAMYTARAEHIYIYTIAARPLGACDCAAECCAVVASRMPQLCICAVTTEACSRQVADEHASALRARAAMRLCTVANVTNAAQHVRVQPQRASERHASLQLSIYALCTVACRPMSAIHRSASALRAHDTMQRGRCEGCSSASRHVARVRCVAQQLQRQQRALSSQAPAIMRTGT